MAAGILDKPLSHSEVIEVTTKTKDKFKNLILETLCTI
jgi:purine nucleoside phosphorylase